MHTILLFTITCVSIECWIQTTIHIKNIIIFDEKNAIDSGISVLEFSLHAFQLYKISTLNEWWALTIS